MKLIYFIPILMLFVGCSDDESKIVIPDDVTQDGQWGDLSLPAPQQDTITAQTPTVNSIDSSYMPNALDGQRIEAVQDVYGGTCVVKKGNQTEGKSTGNYLELEVKDSEVLAGYQEAPEIPSAKVAWLYYNTSSEEAKEVDFVKTSIFYTEHDKSTNDYPISDLEIVASKLKVIDKLNGHIADLNKEKVREMLSTELYDFPADDIVSNLDTVERVCGKPTGIDLYSFQFYELAEGNDESGNQRILHISYTLEREDQSHECSAEFYADLKSDQILILKYIY